MNPYKIVETFEKRVAEYAGSKYAVAVDCCSHALFLSCKWCDVSDVIIPKQTYVSVPCEIIHSGGTVYFDDTEWVGAYQLRPYPIWDSAKRFYNGMYQPGTFWCVSFHISKIVPVGRGGMILHDDDEADKWFRMARYSGRHEPTPHGEDTFDMVGWNFTMDPSSAIRGLQLMQRLPNVNADQTEDYPDLSKHPAFRRQHGVDDSKTA